MQNYNVLNVIWRTELRLACLAGLIFVLGASPATGQCAGSGTVWSCLAGSTSAQVESAINSASNNAIITFQSGTYTVGSIANQAVSYMVSQTKGVTLICATPPATVGAGTLNPCTLNIAGGAVFGSDRFSGTNTNFYRLSGFVIDLQATKPGLGTIYWDTYNGSAPGSAATVTNIRLDHNTFQNGTNGAQTSLIGSGGQQIQVYGVYDHNLYTGSSQMPMVIWAQATIASPPASQLGTANNLFLENNTLAFTAVGNASAEGCTDGWGGAAFVARYNTSTDCLWAAHGVTHNGGPANYEFYGNSVTMDAGAVAAGTDNCYRAFHHQGSGEIIIFNNSFTCHTLPASSEVISVIHYRDYPKGIDGVMPSDAAQCNGTVNGPADDPLVIDGNRTPAGSNYGYRCWRQPGSDPATGNLMPVYVWNNYLTSGGQVNMENYDQGGNPDYWSYHFNPNRDYYNAVSASAQSSATAPFNGNSGMGFGALTNRPVTCATGPVAADAGHGGVGYFATDVGAQGTLYQCSATNTWTVWYTPYVYPHPLVTSGGGSPAVVPPKNLTTTAH